MLIKFLNNIPLITPMQQSGGFNLDFDFYMPARVISGYGCLKKCAPYFKELGERCLIITGSSSAKTSGALGDAEEVLKSAGISYVIYDKIGPNPLLSSCFEAGSVARKFHANFIMGIGGGSPLDAAKAAAVFASNPSFAPEDIFKRSFSRALPIVLIGTTAGTGSEVTPTSVLTIDSKNIKKSIHHKCCFAAVSVADPHYTESCPYNLTVTTALDALCHTTEGYFAANAGDISRNAALKALKLIWHNLVWLRDHPNRLPDKSAREQLYYGSLWAGITLNLSGTGFPHPSGYVLSTDFAVPHGKACAVFLPYYIRHNAPANPSLTVKFLAAAGCGLDDFCKTVEALTNLKGIKMSPEQCEEFSKRLEGRANLTNALCPSTTDEIKAIYEKLFLN